MPRDRTKVNRDRPPAPYDGYTWQGLARYCRQIRILNANLEPPRPDEFGGHADLFLLAHHRYIRARYQLQKKRNEILALLEVRDNLFV